MRTISAVDDLAGGFAVVDGLEAVRQRVLQHLRFTLGEWFLRPDEGVPYFEGLFSDSAGIELASQLIVSEVLGIEEVTSVEVLRAVVDPATRRLQLELRVGTTGGENHGLGERVEMARVTSEGIEATTLQGYIDALEATFRSALGSDLDLSPETPQSQLIGTLALTLAEVNEALVAVANGMSRSRAIGSQLDDLGSLLGVPRLEGGSDEEYRVRYGRMTMRNARGLAEAILAAVLDVDGVTDALIRENDTGSAVTVQSKSIGAHSIYVVVDGGTDADVAAAIARSKRPEPEPAGPPASTWHIPVGGPFPSRSPA